MTFIYEPDPYSMEMYRMSENELPTSRLSKLIVWLSDRQTNTTEVIYQAASRWSFKLIVGIDFTCNFIDISRKFEGRFIFLLKLYYIAIIKVDFP